MMSSVSEVPSKGRGSPGEKEVTSDFNIGEEFIMEVEFNTMP